MKKVLLCFVASVLMFSFYSCEKTSKPTGNFTYSLKGNFSPVSVDFKADYIDANSYSWDFGDNSTATGSDVSHTYPTQGVYTVTLTIKGEGGEITDTKTVNIPGKAAKMKIYKVDVVKFPTTKSDGGSWDTWPSSGADLVLLIGTEGDDADYLCPTKYNDAVGGNTYSYDVDYTFTNFSSRLTIVLYDEDLTAYEPIDGVVGSVNYLRETYPSGFDFSYGEVAYKVYVTWE